MSDDLMTIRQMCDAFDVTPRTLRFYESKELLAPRRDGQRRWYTRRDRARLKLILRGKRFGFTLEQIRQLLDLYNAGDGQRVQIEQSYAIGRERLSGMIAQRDDLNAAIADLERQLQWGEEMLAQMQTRKAG
jgi:DNA-binding transcriptional MerR regulator